MKRYKLLGVVLTGMGKPDEIRPSEMFEDPDGEWVKWEDVGITDGWKDKQEKLLNRLDEDELLKMARETNLNEDIGFMISEELRKIQAIWDGKEDKK